MAQINVQPTSQAVIVDSDDVRCRSIFDQTVLFETGPGQGVRMVPGSHNPEDTGFRVWRLLEDGGIHYEDLYTGTEPIIFFPPLVPVRSVFFVQGMALRQDSWQVTSGRCSEKGEDIYCEFDGSATLRCEKRPSEALQREDGRIVNYTEQTLRK